MAIVVVSSSSSKPHNLFKLLEMGRKMSGFHAGFVIGKVFLWDHTVVPAHQLKGFLCSKGGMAGHRSLVFHMYIVGCMVDEYASSSVHVLCLGLSSGREQSTFCTANVVVDRNLLAWVKVVRSNDSLSISDCSGSSTWRRTASLLSELASCTFWCNFKLGGCLVKSTGSFCVA
jgi:hypothetical protein